MYLAALLAPLGFLVLVGAWDLVGALPALAQNLLSRDPIVYNHRTQYQAFVLPFLILAAISGYSRLAARRGGQLAVARWWPRAEQQAAYTVLAQLPPAASIAMYRT